MRAQEQAEKPSDDYENHGSRFASLATLTDKEGDNDKEENTVIIDESNANQGRSKTEAIRKGKKPVNEGTGPMDGVELCASEPSLLQEIEGKMKTCMKENTDSRPTLAGRIKERALKDVSNNLVIQPAKLKPTWFGPRANKGVGNREVGPISGWATHGNRNKTDGTNKGVPIGPTMKVGPAHTRPPDTSTGG